MKRLFITGATGFIGRHLLNHLAKNRDILVRAFVKEDEQENLPGVEIVKGDIRNLDSLKKAFSGAKFDAVVHLAAVIKPPRKEDYTSVNVQGTKDLVQLSESSGVKKFIFISTDFVLYLDKAPNDYGKSKKLCEEIIFASNLDFTLFRPAPVYGPGDTKNFASLITLLKKYPVLPAVNCYMEPVYVEDVVKMVIGAMENPLACRKIYNLPGGSFLKFSKILKIMSRLLGLKRLIITLPSWFFLLALKIFNQLIPDPLLETYQVQKWLKNQPLDASMTKSDFNYAPLSFEEGMQLTIKNS